MAAKRYCCANDTERPIARLLKQNKLKLLIKTAYAHTSEKILFIIEAREKPNLRPFIFIILDANKEPTAVPTIIKAVGNVDK